MTMSHDNVACLFDCVICHLEKNITHGLNSFRNIVATSKSFFNFLALVNTHRSEQF